jgi:hypothetical protein
MLTKSIINKPGNDLDEEFREAGADCVAAHALEQDDYV